MALTAIRNGIHRDSKQKQSLDQWSDQIDRKCCVVYVYLIPEKGKERFKIGYTTDFAKRDKQHRAETLGESIPLVHLCSVRATVADEKHIHRLFKKHRWSDGSPEIFSAVDDIAEWVRWLRDRDFVYVPDCECCRPIEQLPEVEFHEWKPSGEHRKKPAGGSLFHPCGPLDFAPRELTVDDFYTSPLILESARSALGGAIDLDPASHPIANREVKANRFYSVNEDGLRMEWSGRVWLNPPFSQWADWVPKIIGEWTSGRIAAMCLLCATRTLTAQYFAPIHKATNAVCILHGRIPFWGGRATTPDDGHAVFYFGNDIASFCKSFAELGTIYAKT